MAACRSSSENTGKMSLIPIFNKKSPRAHMELGLNVLGVHGKLVKYVVQKKKLKKNNFSSHKLPKQQSTSFWSQGILGIKAPSLCSWSINLSPVKTYKIYTHVYLVTNNLKLLNLNSEIIYYKLKSP
jgi:hypothetical protein